MAQIRLHGYTDPLSLKAGQRIQAHVSLEGAQEVKAQLVRLIHGDEHPEGPGFVEQLQDAACNRAWPAGRQYVQQGAWLEVDDAQQRLALAGGAVTLHAFVFPTLPGAGRQVILGCWDVTAQLGLALGINASGHLELWVGDGQRVDAVAAEVPLWPHVWMAVSAGYDPATGEAWVHQQPVANRYNSRISLRVTPLELRSQVHMRLRVKPQQAQAGFLIAAAHESNAARGAFKSQCFNGKIDRPGVLGHSASSAQREQLALGQAVLGTLAFWDTSLGLSDHGVGDQVQDTGPHGLHAHGVNRPIRGQTGWNWNGRNDSYRLAPQEYGAIEFHDDALTDCRWTPTFEWTVPEDLKSGCYAFKLTAGEGAQAAEEYLPFFVRARVPKAPVALLIPTASYLAYGNAQLAFEVNAVQSITSVVPVFQQSDVDYYRDGLPFGLSAYDHHRSGEGCSLSSWRRPLINMRPKCRMPGVAWPWQFPADLSIVAWLEHQGIDYEVLTDFDLHAEGVDALKPYRSVINGTHAEYYSERMMDATEDYLAQGGRLMYLSGNGYYWVTGFRDDEPWVMEVRKLDSGSRAWQARPGEGYLASTGERSGLWRHRGRAPQKLVGTGFASEGMDQSVPYRRMADSWHKSVSWIFEGVPDEVFGDFGLAGGGAAGVEVDRYDLALGSPPHAKLLAASDGFSDNYPLVQEEIMYNHPGMGGTQHPGVRCDMVYFTTPQHGAVFSPSSIAWSHALPCRGFDNPVSTIMANVLKAFMTPGPLPGAAFNAEEKLWR
jgi:N,N-dimethylformamidase